MDTKRNIYKDIAERTGGDIYIGVVGPVRTGKSTFIKKFMDTLVIPNIENSYDRQRAKDEMPQSASGKTIMTTEPKFIPDEAVAVTIGDSATMHVKMIDCVGYVVPDAIGHIEEGQPRMVRTPWDETPIPFDKAAETGTEKVIREHSTIGILVTTDGSITEIPRESYVEAEERVVRELKGLQKPFAIILNSARPESEEARELGLTLEKKYGVPVALVNCLELDGEDIRQILELILLEFPVAEIEAKLPEWLAALDKDHKLSESICKSVLDCGENIHKTGDIAAAFSQLSENEYIDQCQVKKIDLGNGKAEIEIVISDEHFYETIGELTGLDVHGKKDLMDLLCDLSVVKKEYDKVKSALDEVEATGYGIVTPKINDMHLEKPEMVKQPGGYGVKLKASAPSIHMIKANIETEISPTVGTEQQSGDLVNSLLKQFEDEPEKIWTSNIFGKTLYELINEGLHTKLAHMPEDARKRLGETLERIINEGSGGLICILL